jgi:uncharacterized membrane protein
MAALAGTSKNAMQVALAHLFFNLFGILIWYPIPFMRRVPLYAATQLGKTTRAWKGFAFVYLGVMFMAFPLLLYAISEMFSSKDSTLITIATILLIILVVSVGYFAYWWKWKDGKAAAGLYFENRKARVKVVETIPYDLHWAVRKTKAIQDYTSIGPAPTPAIPIQRDPYVMAAVEALIRHCGLPSDEGDGGDEMGNLIHKDKEPMPDVDMSNWFKFQAVIILSVCLVLGLIGWGVAELWQLGTVAGRGTAGYIIIIVGCLVLFRLYSYITSGAREYSQAQYRDLQLKKTCKATYLETMGQLMADLMELVQATGIYIVSDQPGSSQFLQSMTSSMLGGGNDLDSTKNTSSSKTQLIGSATALDGQQEEGEGEDTEIGA